MDGEGEAEFWLTGKGWARWLSGVLFGRLIGEADSCSSVSPIINAAGGGMDVTTCLFKESSFWLALQVCKCLPAAPKVLMICYWCRETRRGDTWVEEVEQSESLDFLPFHRLHRHIECWRICSNNRPSHSKQPDKVYVVFPLRLRKGAVFFYWPLYRKGWNGEDWVRDGAAGGWGKEKIRSREWREEAEVEEKRMKNWWMWCCCM